MELVKKQISPESEIAVTIQDGKLALMGSLDTEGMDVQLSVSVGIDYLIDELAKKIPGQIDDAIFAILKASLKAL